MKVKVIVSDESKEIFGFDEEATDNVNLIDVLEHVREKANKEFTKLMQGDHEDSEAEADN